MKLVLSYCRRWGGLMDRLSKVGFVFPLALTGLVASEMVSDAGWS